MEFEDTTLILSTLSVFLIIFILVNPIINNNLDPASCLKDNNCLLLKGGTNKSICNWYSYKNIIFVDNWYNSKYLIDKCEMLSSSEMEFRFKMHDQSYKNHSGKIKVTITSVSEFDYYAIQVLTSSDKGDYAQSWDFCGNIDEFRKGIDTKSIICSGDNIQYIKIINAPWNEDKKIYIDNIEVSRYYE